MKLVLIPPQDRGLYHLLPRAKMRIQPQEHIAGLLLPILLLFQLSQLAAVAVAEGAIPAVVAVAQEVEVFDISIIQP